MNLKKLKDLYEKTSKHSNYQILPNYLNTLIDDSHLVINSRFEAERLDYLKSHIDFRNKKVLDIGGNTGYFSFQSIEEGAKQVDYVEGNKTHYEFVKFASEDLNINAFNKYLNFNNNSEISSDYDIILLFNVIHHLGDDFGDQNISMEKAKTLMGNCINYFQGKTDILVLQMGFCWKGDRDLLLFENGMKEEMINYLKKVIVDKWEIQSIGVAEIEENKTVYKSLNERNIKRNNAIGEFRNRPIFILKSK